MYSHRTYPLGRHIFQYYMFSSKTYNPPKIYPPVRHILQYYMFSCNICPPVRHILPVILLSHPKSNLLQHQFHTSIYKRGRFHASIISMRNILIFSKKNISTSHSSKQILKCSQLPQNKNLIPGYFPLLTIITSNMIQYERYIGD